MPTVTTMTCHDVTTCFIKSTRLNVCIWYIIGKNRQKGDYKNFLFFFIFGQAPRICAPIYGGTKICPLEAL